MKLTPEEKKYLEDKTPEEIDKFVAERAIKIEKLSVKTVALTTLLLESLEELEGYNMFRQLMKNKVKSFKKPLESYINDLFKTKALSEDDEQRKETADFICSVTKTIEIEVDRLLTSIYEPNNIEHEEE
jgi:glutamyl/glutaminyl-tRNA synthetase